jgi:hypothetical protein
MFSAKVENISISLSKPHKCQQQPRLNCLSFVQIIWGQAACKFPPSLQNSICFLITSGGNVSWFVMFSRWMLMQTDDVRKIKVTQQPQKVHKIKHQTVRHVSVWNVRNDKKKTWQKWDCYEDGNRMNTHIRQEGCAKSGASQMAQTINWAPHVKVNTDGAFTVTVSLTLRVLQPTGVVICGTDGSFIASSARRLDSVASVHCRSGSTSR